MLVLHKSDLMWTQLLPVELRLSMFTHVYVEDITSINGSDVYFSRIRMLQFSEQ